MTIADPDVDECPLIGCSSGFGTLCGYNMDEIVGRNCRFLVDPVPKKFVSSKVRNLARDFCVAVKEGRSFRIPEQDREFWMPRESGEDGIFCAQMNARKDGSLFANMFYLLKVELDDKPYIIGLQTELPRTTLSSLDTADESTLQVCHEACQVLDQNLGEVERVLAGMFWYSGPMRRQQGIDPDDPYKAIGAALGEALIH